jgi:hypothetical protein
MGPRAARSAAAPNPPESDRAAVAARRAVAKRRLGSIGAPLVRRANQITSRTTSAPTKATKSRNMTPIQMNAGQAMARPAVGSLRPRSIAIGIAAASRTSAKVAMARHGGGRCESRTSRAQR